MIEQLPIVALLLLFVGWFIRITMGIRDQLNREHDAVIELKKDIEYLKQMRNDQREELHVSLERTKDVSVWFERLRNLENRVNIKTK